MRRATVDGGWLWVPHDGAANAKLIVRVGGGELRAFYDRTTEEGATVGWAVVRPPAGMRPRAKVTLLADGREVWSGQLR